MRPKKAFAEILSRLLFVFLEFSLLKGFFSCKISDICDSKIYGKSFTISSEKSLKQTCWNTVSNEYNIIPEMRS